MELPTWAVKHADSQDWEAAKKAYDAGTAKIEIRNLASLSQWMKGKGWRRPWFFLQESFIRQLFANPENFRLALREYMAEIRIPKSNAVIPHQELKEMDESYDARSWSYVVESLREIRRAIEAGVVIEVDGKTLKTWNDWYSWAHSRYYMLEESSDKWIGDDR
jgi:hypothetical protein